MKASALRRPSAVAACLALLSGLVLGVVPVVAQAATVTYEAENGTLANGAVVQSASAASGGHTVGGMNNVGSYVRVNSVDGGAGGSAAIQVRYANGYGDTRKMSLYVNGADVGQLSFPTTGGWNTFATVSTSVTLSQGSTNTIAVQLDSGDYAAADIDDIKVTAAPPGGCP